MADSDQQVDEIFCAVCGNAASWRMAHNAILQYGVNGKMYRLQVIACSLCMVQINAAMTQLDKRHGNVAALPSVLRALRDAHAEQKPNILEAAVEAVERDILKNRSHN